MYFFYNKINKVLEVYSLPCLKKKKKKKKKLVIEKIGILISMNISINENNSIVS